MTAAMIELHANQPPERFYRGGAKIDRFRGAPTGADFRPEDWVASVTALSGETERGLTTLPDGTLLATAIQTDPVGWLGPQHVDSFGARTMLLVKLLDAGQRLPVHVHPDEEFSRAHLQKPFGKAEAWYILEGGQVHLGLKAPVDSQELLALVESQHTEALIDLLYTREVRAGDVVYVPPRELHAIGEGVFLLELQQPTDLSILLEWKGFALDGNRHGHLGVGFQRALEAIRTEPRSADEIDHLVRPAGEGASVLPIESERFFRLERRVISTATAVETGFAVIVVENGTVTITPRVGDPLTVSQGATVVVPFSSGSLTLTGRATVLICRPPSP